MLLNILYYTKATCKTAAAIWLEDFELQARSCAIFRFEFLDLELCQCTSDSIL